MYMQWPLFFAHFYWKVLSTFQTVCPVWVQVAQTVVHFAEFQVQARKRGVLGWVLGCFVYVHIPKRVFYQSSHQNQATTKNSYHKVGTNLAQLHAHSAIKDELNTLVTSQQLAVTFWQVEHNLNTLLSAHASPCWNYGTISFADQILHTGTCDISILQNKLTYWVLAEGTSANEISTIGKQKFRIIAFCWTEWFYVQTKMAHFHCLAFQSRWFEVFWDAGSISGRTLLRQKVVVGQQFANSAKFYFSMTWDFKFWIQFYKST